jgi:ribosomal-protein-alanine N-acetyltransferase
MGVSLRPMRWWDIEALLPAERELFGASAWTPEVFWSELAHPETRRYVVAVEGEELLGYAGLVVPGAEADIQTVAVLPGRQGRGIGRVLLTGLVERAAADGATSLMLEVRADNAAAIALYTSAGFERLAVRRRYYQPDDIDAWVMRLRPLVNRGSGADGGAGPA